MAPPAPRSLPPLIGCQGWGSMVPTHGPTTSSYPHPSNGPHRLSPIPGGAAQKGYLSPCPFQKMKLIKRHTAYQELLERGL